MTKQPRSRLREIFIQKWINNFDFFLMASGFKTFWNHIDQKKTGEGGQKTNTERRRNAACGTKLDEGGQRKKNQHPELSCASALYKNEAP